MAVVSTDAAQISLGIVGLGKIATDQHVPAVRRSDRFVLHSTADPAGGLPSVPHFTDIAAMLAGDDVPAAVAICTPPQMRYAIARAALQAGCHVLLEKPPCATVGEVGELEKLAGEQGVTLFCAWHSRFAPAVAPASEWLRDRRLRRMQIAWREDVRDWHPGQAWIWQAGGFGVFDPGINALSIAAAIAPSPLFVRDALLRVPANCVTPAAAELALSDTGGADIRASFDFLRVGPPEWTMAIETDDGRLELAEGGGRLAIDGEPVPLAPRDEYPAVYACFAALIAARASDADSTPLRLVADAERIGRLERLPALDASYGL